MSGEDAGVFIQHEIVDRLGTSYPATPDMPSPAARGYVIVPAGQPERDVTAVNPAVPATAGAMISTLEGLHAWAPALAEGRLLSPESHRVQTALVEARLSPELRTGYGAGLISINDFVGHNGAVYGYKTAMFHLPDAGATISSSRTSRRTPRASRQRRSSSSRRRTSRRSSLADELELPGVGVASRTGVHPVTRSPTGPR